MASELEAGFYDELISRELRRRIIASRLNTDESELEEADWPEALSVYIRDILRRNLAEVRKADREAVTEQILRLLNEPEALLESPPRRLLSLLPELGVMRPRYGSSPQTPLSQPALLTNARGEPTLGSEIGSELGSSDQVDLLCAFVKWYGIRTLEEPLRQLAERGVKLRVITSTYLGSTERVALDRLVDEFNAEVRVSYETQRTRLHAKAWMFHRRTGFDTAYVGSSNLSSTALLDGVEWNVRLTKSSTPDLLHKFEATFDTYWNDPAFERYTPADGERLDRALAVAAGRDRATDATMVSGMEVRPWPHQELMLEALEVERLVHDRHRNLVVAATGTGKTVVAALDYASLVDGRHRPSLLFVAHRKEILEQSLRTYREVLADGGFGELLVGAHQPTQWRHVFASVQSLRAERLAEFAPDAFDVVVIDEFHHAEAASYRRILDHFQPKELLGLTATPERGDGVDVRRFFDNRTAYELRLWDALSADLLAPFHYFGIADNTDLSHTQFQRGRYDAGQLDRLYTGNDARTRIVLKQLVDKVPHTHEMRALGFCAGVAHAEYMAEKFNQAGIPSLAVTGGTPAFERTEAVRRLRDREVNALFTADLFNEGVDIPEVDVALFLRPTDSATIFLQQLGRGLRRTADKAVLTVLDFVGHHRKEFNLAQRFRSVTGGSRASLRRQAENGFPYLPSGSRIVLDRVTQEQVLQSIQASVATTWRAMTTELRNLGDTDLATFLHEADVELADLLRSNRSFTQLRRDVGLPTREAGPHEADMMKRLKALVHVDDADRHAAYRRLLSDDAPHFENLKSVDQLFATMLFFSLWPNGGGFDSVAQGLGSLASEKAFRDEAVQILDWAFGRARHLARPLVGRLSENPLRSHASYSREELAAALRYATLSRTPNNLREGVFFSSDLDLDALLVTLVKTEKSFSPSTMYRDYALNAELFHWESQSRTTVASPTGQRYITQRETDTEVLLFVRSTGISDFGSGAPYVLLGEADYVEHRGEKPIAITWKLRRPMPPEILTEARAAS